MADAPGARHLDDFADTPQQYSSSTQYLDVEKLVNQRPDFANEAEEEEDSPFEMV
ncbi:hypothetical protein GGI18_003277, partial [Coemansia linderi]